MGLSYASLMNEGGYSQLNTGAALTSSTSLTDISPGGSVAGQAYQINADVLQLGFAYLIKANGIISNTATPTLTFGLYYGGIAGTALATTGSITTPSSAWSNTTWDAEWLLRVDGVGTSGSIRTIGKLTVLTATPVIYGMPTSSSSGNNVTVNTGASSNILTIGAQWGTSSASNSIQVIQFAPLRLNEGNI